MKRALITGITGQDGSYLAELLLEKGYEVHGIVRRTSVVERKRLRKIYHSFQDRDKNLFLHYGDMTDSSSIVRVLSKVRPDEIYNLAAQSHVKISFEVPEYTAECDGLGVLRLLEAVRQLGLTNTKIYQASTSELFGKVVESPQNENTPFHPQSPYGAAKLYAYWVVRNYREAYGIFVCNGILFNHESPRRGENFVTRKITKGVAEIKKGITDKILIGNLDAKRDWGHAKEYVEAMWLMLQQDKAEDYVIATGETHSVREFIEESFKVINVNLRWEGSEKDERGIDIATGEVRVEIDPEYFRPLEVDYLVGDISKAKRNLPWQPKVKFKELVKIMVEADLENIGAVIREETIAQKVKKIEQLLEEIKSEKPKDPHIYEPSLKKKALITGITGQDGSYLAEFLLEKGYEVWGVIRLDSNEKNKRIINILDKINLKQGDITDYNFLKSTLKESCPDEIYNLAAQSSVGASFKNPEETMNVNYGGVKNIMTAIDELGIKPKFFQASAVKIFSLIDSSGRINEESTRNPESPYGKSKLKAQQLIEEYRINKGLFACSAFFYNHESPRRGENFVTRKIIQGLAKIKLGLQDKLELGNIDIKIDFGYAKEYVEAMWLMLQQDQPEDYVIATGEAHSIREFIEEAAKVLEMNIKSNGLTGVNGEYTDQNNKIVVSINSEFFRPVDSDSPIADVSKAKTKLNWEAKTKFHDLIKLMVGAELQKLQQRGSS